MGESEELGPLAFKIAADKIRDQLGLLLSLGLVRTEEYRRVSS